MAFHETKQKISVDSASNLVLSRLVCVGTEEVSVTDSFGRVLAGRVKSEINVPHFDRAAMDGFAVIARDTFGCSEHSPSVFEIVGECGVGEVPSLSLSQGRTVEVATGSQVPTGTDAVVKVENTTRSGKVLKVLFPVTPGENVSKIGEDIKKGEVIAEKGLVVRPQDISILLACGILTIEVARQPKVGVIATGNELIEAQKTPIPGKVFNVNSHALSAYITIYGGMPINMGIVQDSMENLRDALESALKNDLVVFSGGTSVGKRDLLPDLISSAGELLFKGVSMRPGGPTAFGIVNRKPVFLLPGFPVATMIAFETLVGPAIRKMMGASCLDPRCEILAVLANRTPSSLGRRDYVRVRLETNKEGVTIAHPLRSSGSGVISSMTKADGTVEIPEDVEGLEKGSRVAVKLFPR